MSSVVRMGLIDWGFVEVNSARAGEMRGRLCSAGFLALFEISSLGHRGVKEVMEMELLQFSWVLWNRGS